MQCTVLEWWSLRISGQGAGTIGLVMVNFHMRRKYYWAAMRFNVVVHVQDVNIRQDWMGRT